MTESDARMLALLRAGLWGTPPDASLFSGPVDWTAVWRQACRQTVAALVADGAALLPAPLRPPRGVWMGWLADVVRTERAACRLDTAVTELAARFRAAGLDVALLKGQGVARFYRQPRHRLSGDIDLWPFGRYDEAVRLLASWGGQAREATSYHVGFGWQGVEVEVHRVYADFYHPRNRCRLAGFSAFWEARAWPRAEVGGCRVTVPPPGFDAVYLFLHLFHHFLQVGVGLRQLCDWARLLAVCRDDIDASLLRRQLDALPVGRAADAFASVCRDALGMPASVYPFRRGGASLRRDAALVLRDVLAVGNFGHDTTAMRGFARGRGWRNLPNYVHALWRQLRLFRLCPSEVAAYPAAWVWSKLRT